MILATQHAGIVVQDMEKSLHFWRDVMGLKIAVDFREEGEYIDTVQALSDVKLHMIKLTAPDGKAKLFFSRDPEGNLLEIVQRVDPS